jgi:hypothetical protein
MNWNPNPSSKKILKSEAETSKPRAKFPNCETLMIETGTYLGLLARATPTKASSTSLLDLGWRRLDVACPPTPDLGACHCPLTQCLAHRLATVRSVVMKSTTWGAAVIITGSRGSHGRRHSSSSHKNPKHCHGRAHRQPHTHKDPTRAPVMQPARMKKASALADEHVVAAARSPLCRCSEETESERRNGARVRGRVLFWGWSLRTVH